MSFLHSQLKEKVNNVCMVVSSMWRGPGNIHGFILDGKSYRQGWATVQTLNERAFSSVKMTTPCHRLGEVARRSSWAEGCWQRKSLRIGTPSLPIIAQLQTGLQSVRDFETHSFPLCCLSVSYRIVVKHLELKNFGIASRFPDGRSSIWAFTWLTNTWNTTTE